MTTPNIEELMKMLRAKGCPDWVTARWLMESAADALQSQTERIAELEQELKTAQEGWRCECSTDDACRFARERDTLRAQLEQIAATEPVAARVWIGPYWIDGNEMQYVYSEVGDGEPLFTRPMPAQRCTYCDGTGDVHSIDGEWRGTCHCAQDVTDQHRYTLNALKNVKHCLEAANKMGESSPICDTIWFTPHETLFDYIDAALSKYKGAK